MQNTRGFTLLEVLVALTVVAVALGALLKSTGQSVDNIAYLRDRTFAHWVAQNLLAEYRIRQVFPDPGTQQGSVRMAEREWYWRMLVEKTPDQDLLRLTVEVREAEESGHTLAVLYGFAGQY